MARNMKKRADLPWGAHNIHSSSAVHMYSIRVRFSVQRPIHHPGSSGQRMDRLWTLDRSLNTYPLLWNVSSQYIQNPVFYFWSDNIFSK